MRVIKFLSVVFIFTSVLCCNRSRGVSHNTAGDNIVRPEDYYGIYKGIVPCADCEGIETEIVLKKDNGFIRKTRYLGKDNSRFFEEIGQYSWDPSGRIIILMDINEPDKYYIEKDKITQLDMNGERISGNLSEMYILKKCL